MTTSKHLITALEKSDWLDRLLIMAALVFFILVVLFILKQRLVDRSIRIAFWWTRFIPSTRSTAAHTLEKGVTATSSTIASVASVSTAVANAAVSSIISSIANESPMSVNSPSLVETSTSHSSELLQTSLTSVNAQPTESISISLDDVPSGVPQLHDEL